MSDPIPGCVPFRFDLSDLVSRSVATLYSHLVTRPTGQALRLGIESQIGEPGELCLSILDFTQVMVLDYSCADETVAKLLHRYRAQDRPANAYFLARGVGDHHRETLETVLHRHRLALAAEVTGIGPQLLGAAGDLDRAAWMVVESNRCVRTEEAADLLGVEGSVAAEVLGRLAEQRALVPGSSADLYYALSAFLPGGSRPQA